MVVRLSLKRVVPGSVPPWRALCAESARALKEVSLSAFWVRGSCPRVGRGRGGAPPQLQWPSGRASVSEAGGPGPVVVSGCRNAVCGRAVVFHFRQSRQRGSLSSSVRLIRSLSTFAVETLLALCGAEAGGGAAPQLNTNSVSSPSRGGCFMKRFSAHVVYWPLAHRNSQLLSALATYCLPPANLSRSLLADFCSSSPTSSVALRSICWLRWCES